MQLQSRLEAKNYFRKSCILAYFVLLLHGKRQFCHLPSVATKMCTVSRGKEILT